MKLNSKIVYSLGSLIIALVLLVSATMAWVTMSTNPEITAMQVSLYTKQALLISDEENGNYTQKIDMSQKFSRYVGLKPVSTVDGINWYIPTYNPMGELNDITEFIKDDKLDHANVLAYKEDIEGNYIPLTDKELKDNQDKGYYIYADFWIKTQEEICDVKISVPGKVNPLEQWELDQGTYGTYMLPGLKQVKTQENLAKMDRSTQATIRAGFLVEDDMKEGENNFKIFEPNADLRSSKNKPVSNPDNEAASAQYVKEFDLKEDKSNFQDDMYIPTKPIAFTGDKAAITLVPDNNLIVQLTSTWDEDKLKEKINTENIIGSNEVKKMGRFVQDISQINRATGNYSIESTNIGIASSNVITRLQKETPKKIRMFIWIEGQDVDCWNDVASGDIFFNLELAGQTD